MILLEKTAPVSLKKPTGDFTINLNWNKKIKESGLLGIFKRAQEVDLDLGCFIEYDDGEKYCIQPLGNKFGDKEYWPYIKHSGDDRTGSSALGESLDINGVEWKQIKRVLVYAYIYEGVPVWNKTNAVVTFDVPGNDKLVVNMGAESSELTTCALAEIHNVNGDIKVTKEVRFFKSQSPMDEHYKYGFKWKNGSK